MASGPWPRTIVAASCDDPEPGSTLFAAERALSRSSACARTSAGIGWGAASSFSKRRPGAGRVSDRVAGSGQGVEVARALAAGGDRGLDERARLGAALPLREQQVREVVLRIGAELPLGREVARDRGAVLALRLARSPSRRAITPRL